MIAIKKDDVIKGCADAYRAVTETTDKIKVGELTKKIKSLGRLDDTIEYLKINGDFNCKVTIFDSCTRLKKVWVSNSVSLPASAPDLSPFKNADSSLIIYTDGSQASVNWGEYFNYVQGKPVKVVYNITKEEFERICLGYNPKSFHYEYVDSLYKRGGRYLITKQSPLDIIGGGIVTVFGANKNIYGNDYTNTFFASFQNGKYVIEGSDLHESYEWVCLPGTEDSADGLVPETFLFQNIKTGKYLFNPVFEEGNGSNISFIDDPLTDSYSDFSRQVFNSKAALNSYLNGRNGSGKIEFNPSSAFLVGGTGSYNRGEDPWVRFSCGGIEGFEDLMIVYQSAKVKGADSFVLYSFFNVPETGNNNSILDTSLDGIWRVYHSTDHMEPLKNYGSLCGYRFDLNLKNGEYYLAYSVCTKNVYSKLMLHYYLLNQSMHNGGGYYPSHNFASCLFATPSQNTNMGVVYNTSIRNADSKGGVTFKRQYNYGFDSNGNFVREWYEEEKPTQKSFQVWERVEDDTDDMYEWVRVEDESDIINGEEYIIGSSTYTGHGWSKFNALVRVGTDVSLAVDYFTSGNPSESIIKREGVKWRLYRVGDYYYINNDGYNLVANIDNSLGDVILHSTEELNSVLHFRPDAIGNGAKYYEKYRWKYDLDHRKLISYTTPQNAGEGLNFTALTQIGIDEGGVYLWKKRLKNSNNICIYSLNYDYLR